MLAANFLTKTFDMLYLFIIIDSVGRPALSMHVASASYLIRQCNASTSPSKSYRRPTYPGSCTWEAQRRRQLNDVRERHPWFKEARSMSLSQWKCWSCGWPVNTKPPSTRTIKMKFWMKSTLTDTKKFLRFPLWLETICGARSIRRYYILIPRLWHLLISSWHTTCIWCIKIWNISGATIELECTTELTGRQLAECHC